MGNNIRKLRDNAGLTQIELAERMGIDRMTVYKHESGRLGLKQTLINKYAKALGVQPSDIISNGNTKEKLTEENLALLEQVALGVMGFLTKNDYLNKLNSPQIAHFIAEAYGIFLENKKENKSFKLDDSHFKLLYKQVHNA